MTAIPAVIAQILAIFSSVAEWFGSAMTPILSIFYADGELTILGGLLVIALAISVTFLLFNVVRRFFTFGQAN